MFPSVELVLVVVPSATILILVLLVQMVIAKSVMEAVKHTVGVMFLFASFIKFPLCVKIVVHLPLVLAPKAVLW